MDIILIERVAKLGNVGDVVRVKDGYARNFLLPRGKALRATEANRQQFEAQREKIEARNAELRQQAQNLADRLQGQSVILLRQAGETGQLYGSVSTRDISDALAEKGLQVARNQIILNAPIKTLGLHTVPVHLYGDIDVTVTANVARSADEATRQSKGENLSVKTQDVAEFTPGTFDDEGEAA